MAVSVNRRSVPEAMHFLKGLDEIETTDLLSQKVQKIKECILSNNLHNAIPEAKLLCRMGIGLINEEVNNKTRFTTTPLTRVVNELNKITSPSDADQLYRNIASEIKLHRPLSKAYRIFVELTWYQFHRQGYSILETTRDEITQASKARNLLPSRATKTKFNYNCTEQAATLLKLANDVYFEKFAGHISNVIKAVADRSIGDFAAAFLSFTTDIKKDYTRSWYLDTHYLHWVSASTTNVQDFVQITDVKLDRKELKKQSNEYTLCLTTIFMEFIRDNIAEKKSYPEIKAVEYIGTLATLRNNWHILKRFDKSLDPFYETQSLAKGYLNKMIDSKNKYNDYSAASEKTLEKIKHSEQLKKDLLADIKEEQLDTLNRHKNLQKPQARAGGEDHEKEIAELKNKMTELNSAAKEVDMWLPSLLEKIEQQEKEDLDALLK